MCGTTVVPTFISTQRSLTVVLNSFDASPADAIGFKASYRASAGESYSQQCWNQRLDFACLFFLHNYTLTHTHTRTHTHTHGHYSAKNPSYSKGEWRSETQLFLWHWQFFSLHFSCRHHTIRYVISFFCSLTVNTFLTSVAHMIP